MKLKERLDNIIQKKKEQYERGKKITEQMKAEKLRKKMNRLQDAKPGAVTAIRQGLVTKASPWDVMKEEYNRRKYEREHK